ncbi:unnamed protein product [Polarella glacialis]|uniref:Uncharacterized protein n=1 Tax=Polarella glacialis TaxID=89957 RepID=A0A813GZ37_POLGL|nr:unnamed protein product [Polarella glacialis]
MAQWEIPASESVFAGISAILLLCQGCILVKSAWETFRSSGPCQLKRLVQSCQWKRFWRTQDLDPVAKIVSSRMDHRRIKQARAALVQGSNFLGLLCLSILWSILHHGKQRITSGQSVILLVSLLLGLLATLFPTLVRRTTLYLWYSSSMMMLILGLVFAGTRDHLLHSSLAMWVFRLLLSVAHLDAVSATFWNGLYFATSCSAYFVFASDDQTRINLDTLVFLEMMMLASVTSLVIGFERISLVECRMDVEARGFKNQKTATGKLLNIVCELVFKLDTEMRFTEDNVAFKTFLMLSGGRSLLGRTLMEFMRDPDDKQAFKKMLLAADPAGDTCAGVFHTRMSDSVGSMVTVEIFYCKFEGIDYRMRYLVGIRECTDVPSITLRSFSKTKSRGPRPKGLTSSGRSKLTGAFPSGRSFIDVAAAVDADSFGAAAGFLDTEPMPDRPSLLLKEEAEEEISAPDDSEPEVEVARDAVRAEALSPRLDPAAKPQPETQDGSDGVPRFFQNSQLSFPALKQTSMTVHDITLLDAMGRWNLPVSRLMCCAFHAHTLELKSGIKRFSKMQCRPGVVCLLLL